MQGGMLSWNHRKGTNTSIFRLYMVVLLTFQPKKYSFHLLIWDLYGTAKTVHSSPMKSRKRLAHGVITRRHLCHTHWPCSWHQRRKLPDTKPQHWRLHFPSFQTSIFNRQDHKLTKPLPVSFCFLFHSHDASLLRVPVKGGSEQGHTLRGM